MSSFIEWLFDKGLLCSVRLTCIARGKILHKMTKLRVSKYNGDVRLKIPKDRLMQELSYSLDRIRQAERKATTTLVGVAFAVSLLGSSSGFLASGGTMDDYGFLSRVLTAAFLLVAMFYLLLSGIFAIMAIDIGKIYRPELGRIAPIVSTDEEAKWILYSIDQNYNLSLLRNNNLVCSFQCLRNGLIAILVIGCVLILSYILQHMNQNLTPLSL